MELSSRNVCQPRAWQCRGYLVAGAPAADWDGGEGSELFGSQTWQAADLLDSYAKRWKFWRGDVKTHPLRLPASMSTRHVATAAINVRGGDWQLRCVEVAADDREWMPVLDLQEKQDETTELRPAMSSPLNRPVPGGEPNTAGASGAATTEDLLDEEVDE